MSNQIVLIDCPDAKGLVYNITKVIYDLGLNIISNHEFVDSKSGYFFMRTVLEGSHPEEPFNKKLKEVLPEEANIRLSTIRKKQVVILATKETHCLGDLLLKNSDGELPCDVKAVISNHDTLRGLTESFDIPFHHISAKDSSRTEHETKILDCLKGIRAGISCTGKIHEDFHAGVHQALSISNYQHSSFISSGFYRGLTISAGF